MRFRLADYIFPAVISMVVVGTNANVDGLFIGRILGDEGLAAINIAWPIVACIASLGTGIGVGGAVTLNRMRGEGDVPGAERVKNLTLLLLLAVGVGAGLLFSLLARPLLALMGAAGAVMEHGLVYARVIAAGAVPQVLGAGLPVLLRNDGKNYRSMVCSLLGLVLHILCNVLWADEWVMAGVAMATVLSQGMVVIPGLFFLRPDVSVKPEKKALSQVLKNAAAPFGINFVPSLVLLFTNASALSHGGVAAVSAYAAMSYAVYTFDYIFQGVCDGIQPVISYCHGAADKGEARRALRSAGLLLSVPALAFIALTPVLIAFLPGLLGVSGDAAELILRAFWIYAASYPLKAAVKLICSYYYATEQTGRSNFLVYLDPLLLTPVLLYCLSAAMGIDGVWLSMPLSQLVICAVGATMILKKR